MVSPGFFGSGKAVKFVWGSWFHWSGSLHPFSLRAFVFTLSTLLRPPGAQVAAVRCGSGLCVHSTAQRAGLCVAKNPEQPAASRAPAEVCLTDDPDLP